MTPLALFPRLAPASPLPPKLRDASIGLRAARRPPPPPPPTRRRPSRRRCSAPQPAPLEPPPPPPAPLPPRPRLPLPPASPPSRFSTPSVPTVSYVAHLIARHPQPRPDDDRLSHAAGAFAACRRRRFRRRRRQAQVRAQHPARDVGAAPDYEAGRKLLQGVLETAAAHPNHVRSAGTQAHDRRTERLWQEHAVQLFVGQRG